VWHHDGLDPAGRATLQLGDGDFCAAASGAPVVSDFRQADVAAGGEGAPVSALTDAALFAEAPRPLAILNLGGMANLTLLAADGGVTAFDTGPCGSLLDGLARRLLDRSFDPDGESACRGRADEGFVELLLAHPFFDRPPPRSTGRDTCGEAFVDEVLQGAEERGLLVAGGAPDDLLASAAEFVAAAVARSFREHLPEACARTLVAGGGVHHRRVMEALARRVGGELRPSTVVGVDPDAREALVFATLAARCVLGEPVTHPAATGAAPGRVLGKISPPAR
jgi:anhydro-N-acetylmuramic acid kinase